LRIEKVLFLLLLIFSFVGVLTHGVPFRGMFFGDTLFFKKSEFDDAKYYYWYEGDPRYYWYHGDFFRGG